MRLTSTDGTVVELRPLRYQFGPPSVSASTSASATERWDANWLVVTGEVELPDGRTWSFTDPCLTTGEARELGSWLEQVRRGTVVPTAPGGEDEPALVFTEPELALSLAARDEGSTALRVHLSLGALPPWLQGPGAPDLHAYVVEVTLTDDGLADAARAWDQELAAFPVR